jgi:hypothetical protein
VKKKQCKHVPGKNGKCSKCGALLRKIVRKVKKEISEAKESVAETAMKVQLGLE